MDFLEAWKSRTPRHNSLLAIALVAVALAITYYSPALRERTPFLLSLAAVVVGSILFGALRGALMLVLSGVFACFFILPPAYKFGVGGFSVPPIVGFSCIGLLVIWAIGSLQTLLQKIQSERAATETARLALEESHRAKDRFLAIVSHELRAPLNPMLLGVEELREMAVSNPELNDLASLFERSLRQEKKLVEDLLDTQRIQNGKAVVGREPLDLHALLEGVIQDHQRTALDEGLALSFVPAAGVDRVAGSRERLLQVARNLILNSIKFTPKGGSITVKTEGNGGGWIEVSVSDTGTGIDGELLPRVFEIFVQGNEARKGTASGLGLGLSICKGLIEEHGGEIRAASPE